MDGWPMTRKVAYRRQTVIKGQGCFTTPGVTAGDTACSVNGVFVILKRGMYLRLHIGHTFRMTELYSFWLMLETMLKLTLVVSDAKCKELYQAVGLATAME